MTPLQQAAQHLIDRWDSNEYNNAYLGVHVTTLRKALKDEQATECSSDEWLANCPQSVRDLADKIKQAQAVEPVAWSVTVGDDFANCIEITHCKDDAYSQYKTSTADRFKNLFRIQPLYTHPAPSAQQIAMPNATLKLEIEFDNDEMCEITAHGTVRDMNRLQTRIKYWMAIEEESNKQLLPTEQQVAVPDGWTEAVERAKFYSSGVEVVGSSIFAQFAKAILDMDAELKKAGPL